MTGAALALGGCVADIRNLQVVQPGILLRSGQPSARGLRYARDVYGIRTVIDLNPWVNERERALALGLDYVSLPANTLQVDRDYLANVLAALRQAERSGRVPVLVHCRTGQDRAGAAVAVFRTVRQGWSADRAIEEMERYRHWSRRVLFPKLPEIVRDAERFEDVWREAARRTGTVPVARPERPWPSGVNREGASDPRQEIRVGREPTLL